MDHASFALKQHLLVLHQAGIRHLLPGAAPEAVSAPVCANHPATDAATGAGKSADCEPAGDSVLNRHPWAGFLEKFPQGARSLWTYEGLGQDLTGQPSAERRRILGRILAAVRLPKGFVGFFPYCLPSGSSLALHLDVFQEALSRLNPTSVVLFRDPPAHSSSQPLNGLEVDVLLQYPSLESFSRMNDTELQAVAETLRTTIFQGP
ncbi:MAG: hypothetical protein ACLGSA_04380 [Acidobacteriota bacterium]